MKIAAFLQLFNEKEKGNLNRCLAHCKKWADDIFIYDDVSTDGSEEVYLQYTDRGHIIFGKENSFTRELFHKQELLTLCLQSNPDWICWLDGDAVFSRSLGTPDLLRTALGRAQGDGYDGLAVHYMNLWRCDTYYRVDNKYNDLIYTAFWRNNGRIHYEPEEGLHKYQHPCGLLNVLTSTAPEDQILHYGFASEQQIARKYFAYRDLGQSGWALDRFLEEETLQVKPVPPECYPEDCPPLSLLVPPIPGGLKHIKNFPSWEAYCASL